MKNNNSTACSWHDAGYSQGIMTKHSLLVGGGSQLGPERLNEPHGGGGTTLTMHTVLQHSGYKQCHCGV